jgi:type I restriction enzyme R subunit
LICHVAFDRPPLTRRERARQVQKQAVFTRYGDTARRVLAALLEKYAEAGIQPLEEAADHQKLATALKLPPFDQVGSPVQIIKAFGGKPKYLAAERELEQAIYRVA